MLHVAHALRGAESEADARGRRGARRRARRCPHQRVDAPARRRPRPRAPGARPPPRRGRRSSRTAARSRPGTRGTIASRRSSTGSRARPAPAGVPRAAAERRRRPRAAAARAGRDEVREALEAAGIPWRDDARTTIAASRATACASICCPRSAACIRPPSRTSCAPPRSSPTRLAVLHEAAGALLVEDGAALDARRGRGRAARARPRRAPSPRRPAVAAGGLSRARARALSSPRGHATGAARVAAASPSDATASCASRPTRPSSRRRPPQPLCVPGRTPFGSLAVSCRAVDEGLDPALAAGARVRAVRSGEHLDGRRATIARMLLEARVPQPLRAVYPVIEVDGRLVCLPGVAVAADARARPGLELAVESP